MSRLSILCAVIGAALFAFIAAPSSPGNAAEDLGPAIGARAPDIGSPPDQTGTPRTRQSLMGQNGLVLFFFRSADWCPYCQAQMMDLNTAVAALERRGYRMAGISYDSPRILKTFIDRRQIGYTLLSDPKSEIIDRYRLRDPQYQPGNPAYGVPRPIILILDRTGTIKAKLYEETFMKRPPATLLISTIDKVAVQAN